MEGNKQIEALPGQKFEHVPGLDNYVRVPTFSGCLDGHGPLQDVELGLQAVVLHQKLLNQRPAFAKVLLAILKSNRTQHRESQILLFSVG